MPKKSSKILKICPNCNEEYYVYPSEVNKRNYCSMKCKKEFNWNTYTCLYCGKEYSARKSREISKFCSQDCFKKYAHETGLEKRICRICGNEFSVLKSSDQLCCSDKCINQWSEYRNSRKQSEYSCDYCGNKMMVSKYRIEHNKRGCYCSPECSQKSQENGEILKCSNCGKDVYKSKSQISPLNFCCEECSVEYHKSHRQVTNKICENCGNEYTIKQSRSETSRFCSHSCLSSWQSRNQRAEKSPGWKGGLAECACTYCGKKIQRKPSSIKNKNHIFCSRDCVNKFYSILENRTSRQKLSDERLKTGLIQYIHPYFSKPHQIISEFLTSINIQHENERIVKYYKTDIYLPENNLGIEINGDFWHCNPLRFGSIRYERQLRTIYKDKSKDTYIKTHYHYQTLYIWERDIYNNLDLCKKLIQLYINNNGVLEDYNSFNYEVINDSVSLKKERILPYQCMNKETISKYIDIIKN